MTALGAVDENARMFRPRFAVSLVAALAAGGVGVAAAAPPRAATPSKVDKSRSALARQAFEDGKKAYTAGDYDKAIDLFRQAYEYRDDAALLFNIGQAYRQKGDAQMAIFYYRAYVRERPKARNRAEVEALIAELSRLPPSAPPAPPQVVEPAPVVRPPLQAAAALPPPPVPESLPELGPPPFATARDDDVPPPRPGRSLMVGGLVSGAAGAAAFATGIVFALKAQRMQDNLTAYQLSGRPWGPEQQDMEAEGRRDSVIGMAGITAGAAALLTGATLVWLGARKSEEAARAASISVEVSPHALATVRATFVF